MPTPQISLLNARQLALTSQFPNNTVFQPGKSGVVDVIQRLGYVQIDTLTVIDRAHHHTLWTRLPDYKPEYLDQALATDRTVFEYWGHALSYLPMSDYRFYQPRMVGRADPYGKWERERFENFGGLMEPALERLRNEGPLTSGDFAQPKDAPPHPSGHPHPAKAALEMLFWGGKIMTTQRRGFQRVYDLTERVLPDYVDLTVPSEAEVGRFFINRALSAYGVASKKELLNHIHGTDKKTMGEALKILVEMSVVTKISIESLSGEYFILPKRLDELNESCSNHEVKILSPFDNFVIQRDRINKLFGFEYTIECYVPKKKRKYGYFVLPVFWKDLFIGRFDAKNDRKSKTLRLINLVFEPDFDAFDECLTPFMDKLTAFARFNGCQSIEFERVKPAKLKAPLSRALRGVTQHFLLPT